MKKITTALFWSVMVSVEGEYWSATLNDFRFNLSCHNLHKIDHSLMMVRFCVRERYPVLHNESSSAAT